TVQGIIAQQLTDLTSLTFSTYTPAYPTACNGLTGEQMLNHSRFAFVLAAALLPSAHAQGRGEPGKSIGSVTVRGNLIVMTLDEGVLGKESLFDLAHRTVRYTPDGAAYRVESAPVKRDSDFG